MLQQHRTFYINGAIATLIPAEWRREHEFFSKFPNAIQPKPYSRGLASQAS
jgi:hypothetical protein